MIDIEIENTEECFVQMWRLIRRSRRVMRLNCKHFCIRRILQLWFDGQANNEFIWQVCNMCGQCGWDKLPSPSLYPRQHREFLRAVVAARLGISYYQVSSALCNQFIRRNLIAVRSLQQCTINSFEED